MLWYNSPHVYGPILLQLQYAHTRICLQYCPSLTGENDDQPRDFEVTMGSVTSNCWRWLKPPGERRRVDSSYVGHFRKPMHMEVPIICI